MELPDVRRQATDGLSDMFWWEAKLESAVCNHLGGSVPIGAIRAPVRAGLLSISILIRDAVGRVLIHPLLRFLPPDIFLKDN